MSKFEVQKHNEGTGPVCPAGAHVTVHYHGTLLDGSVFDSSVDRNEPFKFQVGVGQVIKGWDEGITQLQKGQKATLICPPDYAYGAGGYPPVIPPNSTLKFDVELLDFKAWVSELRLKVSQRLYINLNDIQPMCSFILILRCI